ncbi:MAG: YidC/Oxa1 family membrane protein insertase [Oscillospiraceae bacterium]
MFATIGYYICIPFAALLRLFYTLTGSYGFALILFTLVIKLILLPFQMKSKKGMMRMSKMSGRMQELQKQYKNNQQKYAEEVNKMYAEEGVNPMGGCLWSFLPMPILIALYSIIRRPIMYFMMLGKDALKLVEQKAAALGYVAATGGAAAYTEIEMVKLISTAAPNFASTLPGWINVDYTFLGIDLSATPTNYFSALMHGDWSWNVIALMLIPILSGLLSFVLSKITMSTQATPEGSAAATNKMMMYMMPLMSVYIGFILPAALGVYWIAQSVFSILQEAFLGKFYGKKLEAEEAEREEKRIVARQLRMEEAKKLAEQQRLENAKNPKKAAKAAAEKAAANKKPKTNENGRVGERPYARGRTFSEDHYSES